MHFEQFEYLRAIAAYGSMSIAGEQLHVSPQAISLAMKKLEKELGFPLLIRTSQGSQLSPYGKEVADFADYFLSNWSALIAKLRAKSALREDETTLNIHLSSILDIPIFVDHLKTSIPFGNVSIISQPSIERIVESVEGDLGSIGIFLAERSKIENISTSCIVKIARDYHYAIRLNKRNPLTQIKNFGFSKLSGQTILVNNKKGSADNVMEPIIERLSLDRFNTIYYNVPGQYAEEVILANKGILMTLSAGRPRNSTEDLLVDKNLMISEYVIGSNETTVDLVCMAVSSY